MSRSGGSTSHRHQQSRREHLQARSDTPIFRWRASSQLVLYREGNSNVSIVTAAASRASSGITLGPKPGSGRPRRLAQEKNGNQWLLQRLEPHRKGAGAIQRSPSSSLCPTSLTRACMCINSEDKVRNTRNVLRNAVLLLRIPVRDAETHGSK